MAHPANNKKLAWIFARQKDPALCRILEEDGWAIEPLDCGAAITRAPALSECSIGVVDLFALEDEWLTKLQSLIGTLREIAWIATVDRALVNDDRLREFIAINCVDYQTRPLERERVLFSLGHAAGMAALARNERNARPTSDGSTGLIGQAPIMRQLRRSLRKVAAVDAPVLVTGESGTGKELVARAIHELSGRRDQRYIAVNCVSLPPSLIHAELFGYERGAFTGAHRSKVGHFESAHRGTILLDEIGDLPLDLQALLLRFLEEHVVRRVGGRDEIAVDVRVLAATNVDLEAAVRQRRFREDLYYRLNVLRISTPRLGERREDVELLAHAFLERFAGETGGRVTGFAKSALAAMRTHDWPGNVRELLNRVRRAIVMCEGRLVTARDLNFEPVELPANLNLDAARAQAERKTILAALRSSGGGASRAARMLGVSRATLYRLLEKHALNAHADDPPAAPDLASRDGMAQTASQVSGPAT